MASSGCDVPLFLGCPLYDCPGLLDCVTIIPLLLQYIYWLTVQYEELFHIEPLSVLTVSLC